MIFRLLMALLLIGQVQASVLPALKMFRLVDGKKVLHTLRPETRYVAFYLSASWCPPCRKTTPPLIDEYQRMLENKGMPVEIVLVGADQTEQEMIDYMGRYKMRWPALEWNARKGADAYRSDGIPHLVIVEIETGNVISKGTGPSGVEEVVERMRGLTGVSDDRPFRVNGFLDKYGLLIAVALSCAGIFLFQWWRERRKSNTNSKN